MSSTASRTSRLLRWPRRLLLGLLAVLLAYALAVLGLGLIPVHRGWRAAAQPAVTVWVVTNGVHTALVLPQADWNALFPPANTRDPAQAARLDMILIGWGDRRFYLETPVWADLKPGTALGALTGLNGAALHVEYTAAPRADADHAMALALSPEAYARLAAHLRQSIRPDAQGRPIPIAGYHYGATDAFYEATGRYSPFFTCNEWVRQALSAAGVRVPLWSPLDKAIFWQLRRIGPRGGGMEYEQKAT